MGGGEFVFISDISTLLQCYVHVCDCLNSLSTDFIFLNKSVMQYETIFKGSGGSCSFVFFVKICF